jgi:hypothetical protein
VRKEDFLCSKTDCTFSLTGTCFESVDDPTRHCPNLSARESAAPPSENSHPSDETDASNGPARQFASGLELGLQDVARFMRSRYAKLVGVLGQVEAGKTCLLTSLYLQLTGRYLCPQYRFVTSETLLGFEQRARHLRDWSNAGVPDQIVDHTQLGHSRSPAFLHLALHDAQGLRHDFLLPDLPGEWTTRLLSEAATAGRFAFLNRSDLVLIVLEAPKFANARTRNNAATDAAHLLARLANDIRLPKSIPIVLAVTKCDETGGKVPAELSRVADAASGHGYAVATVALAAFPVADAQIPTGFGIDNLLAQLTSPPLARQATEIRTPDAAVRSFLNARGR